MRKVKSLDLIKLLENDGWVIVRINGSHHIMKHPTKAGTLSVPHPKKELGIGIVRQIKKDAGLL
jgi:predicted RNA binding protein YcfA (HicA-like mRNA interferase family)